MSLGDDHGAAEEDVRVAEERVLDGREDERVELDGWEGKRRPKRFKLRKIEIKFVTRKTKT